MSDELRHRLENSGRDPVTPLRLDVVEKRARRLTLQKRVAATFSVAALVGGGWLISSQVDLGPVSLRPAQQGQQEIKPTPSGWIAYGNRGGIWALDATGPGDPADVVQLSSKPGYPQAWSPDGSKLLVLREVKGGDLFERDLFVLNSDGTETRLARADSGGDFTPDGSRVVYGDGRNIYVIDAEGGTPKLLLAPSRRRIEGEGPFKTSLSHPTVSPDGSQVAYFDGLGDSGHSLRVMDSDGTGTRVVLENSLTTGVGHVGGLDWSPDGRRLVFALDQRGVYVVGIDGSGLTKVSSEPFEGFEGVEPHWSPDGSFISYNARDPFPGGELVIRRWDGTQVQEFDYGRSGPWTAELQW
jgi:Tol biopolymer transport system component